MNPAETNEDRRFLVRWVKATFVGWVVGFVLVVVLAMAWGTLGMGESQFMIGVGMGAGVGYAQGRVLQGRLGTAWRWTWASVLGLGLPFLASDLASALWLWFPYSLPGAVLIGGVLVGVLQLRILRPHSDRANWWVLASVVGWTLAAGTAVFINVSGPWGALVALATILFGGVVLGGVTGWALVRILER